MVLISILTRAVKVGLMEKVKLSRSIKEVRDYPNIAREEPSRQRAQPVQRP